MLLLLFFARAARELAAEALASRLAEIDMKEVEFAAFDSLLQSVSREVDQLRRVLEATESRQQVNVFESEQPSSLVQ